MTPEIAVDLFREALWLTALIVGLLVMPSLLVGLLHSLTGSYMPTATLVIVLSAAMALAGWGAGRNLLVQVDKA